MKKAIIEFSASGNQKLERIAPLMTFATGTINYLEAHFNLSGAWCGYDERYAVWYSNNSKKESVIGEDGKTIIPQEVLDSPGILKMNLCFIKNGNGATAARLTSCPVDALKLIHANV